MTAARATITIMTVPLKSVAAAVLKGRSLCNCTLKKSSIKCLSGRLGRDTGKSLKTSISVSSLAGISVMTIWMLKPAREKVSGFLTSILKEDLSAF
jgi:hypothetical protein